MLADSMNIFDKTMLCAPVLFDGTAGHTAALIADAYNRLLLITTPIAALAIAVCVFRLLFVSECRSRRQSEIWLTVIVVALALMYMTRPIISMLT